jgi:hypothetical protein
LSQDLLYQVNADISPMRIWDHYPDRSFPNQGMWPFAGVRAIESEGMQFSYQLIPGNWA